MEKSWKSHGMSWNLVLKIVWEPWIYFQRISIAASQLHAVTTQKQVWLFMVVFSKKNLRPFDLMYPGVTNPVLQYLAQVQ